MLHMLDARSMVKAAPQAIPIVWLDARSMVKATLQAIPIVWWCLLLLIMLDSSGPQAACCAFAGAHSRETMWSGDWVATQSFSASS